MTSNGFDDVRMAAAPAYSIVLSVNEYFNKQQMPFNWTEPLTGASCYITVDRSDSEDLYRKAVSAGNCILRISGDYRVDSPLSFSVRVEAAEKPVVPEVYQEDLFLPVKQNSAHSVTEHLSLLTPAVIQNRSAVLPGAVLTIDTTKEEAFLALLPGSALSGVGIKTEHGAVHESGCTLSGIYVQGELQGEIYWQHSQVNDLCSREHVFLNDEALECAGPRQCPRNKKRNKNHDRLPKDVYRRDGQEQRQVQEPPADADADADADPDQHNGEMMAAAGGGGKKGGGKKDDDDYERYKKLVEAAFKKALSRNARDKRELKNEWDKVPKRFRSQLQDDMNARFPLFKEMQADLNMKL